MLPAALTAGLWLALGQLSWGVDVLGETRVIEPSNASTAGDLLLSPGGTLQYASRRAVLRTAYHPRLLLRTPSERGTSNAQHQATVDGDFVLAPSTRLTISSSLTAGESDRSWLASSPDSAPPLSAQSTNASLSNQLAAAVSTSVQQQVSRNLRLQGSIGYALSGGSDSANQVETPQTQTVTLSVSGSWLERADTFLLTLSGNRGWISYGKNSSLTEGTASWRHAFTPAGQRSLADTSSLRIGARPDPRYESELSVGLSAIGGNSEAQQHTTTPTVTLSLTREPPTPHVGAVTAKLNLRYAPVMDEGTGELTPRAEGTLAIGLRVAPVWETAATGGLGWKSNTTSAEAQTVGQAGLSLSYVPTPKNFSISFGVRAAAIPDLEWAGLVTATFSRIGRF